jgi:uncharacterized protein (DUF1015 family)
MPTIEPIARGLVPVDSPAADLLGAPNYDEFQSDQEVWELLQQRPHSVLRVTMPHCAVPSLADILEEESPAALELAALNMQRLKAEPLVRQVSGVLWIYEIEVPGTTRRSQIGLGGMARTSEIRTEANPGGTIIRNEGIKESKARGRAVLVEVTGCDMGTVNLAVDDDAGRFEAALRWYAASRAPDYETRDEAGNLHRVWLVADPSRQRELQELVLAEPRAYVADGNHRSAAAAMLGVGVFQAVFFPAATMTIAPYNRLVRVPAREVSDLRGELANYFEVQVVPPEDVPFQPLRTHVIGLYDGARWWRLLPRPGTFDPDDAAQDIDADIVQRLLFERVLGIGDAKDERLVFVGANRDARWLQSQVDAGNYRYAVTLPPVTMQQFVRVCLQGKLMPPKSTWFVPKIRSGLMMALL